MSSLPSRTFAKLKAPAVWWLTPRAVDRDEAFRERFLRAAIALITSLGLVSFFVSVLIFRDEWRLLSFPTLHIFALTLCLLAIVAILRNQLVFAGWLMVLLVLIGAGGVILLSRRGGSSVGIFLGLPIFSMVPVVAALVLPQRPLLPVSVASIAAYSLVQYAIPIGDFSIPGLGPQFMLAPAALILLFEGLLLRQLRVEFDARLAHMERSIAETEQAKQQAEAARKRAEAADSAKSQFLANVSHELRTPLNAIIGYDEAMLNGMAGEFSPQQLKLLGIMQTSARRLLTLINDILDLSKIEAGSLAIYPAALDPARVIKEVTDSLGGLAAEKEIYLRVAVAEATPAVILSDRNKLEQIIINLLSNAIKFTTQGGVTIQVDGAAHGGLAIEISDTGIGIPANALSSIFDPFRQVDGTLKRRYQGTGLGLTITKRLVEALEGTLTVESEVGVGSIFRVVLPNLDRAAAEPLQSKPTGQAERVQKELAHERD